MVEALTPACTTYYLIAAAAAQARLEAALRACGVNVMVVV